MAAICVFPGPVPDADAPGKDRVDHPACQYCGAERGRSARSRTVIIYGDGTIVETCSLRCAAVDLYLNFDKIPLSLLVADFKTGRLIDAETAHWVTGGGKTGPGAGRAFAAVEDARAFTLAHGGSAGAFPGAFRAAFKDLCEDLGLARAGPGCSKDRARKQEKAGRRRTQAASGPAPRRSPSAQPDPGPDTRP